MQGEDSTSNIFILNENNCKSQAEGVMDINMDFGQLIVQSLGFADRDEKNNKTEILNNLSEKIIDELMAGTVVFSSLILSFTSFEIIRKKFRKMDIENIIELPEDELTLNIEYFKTKYKNVLESVKNLSERKKLKISDELLLSIDDQIKIGCKNLGLYHAIRPLEFKKDKIIIKNIKMLFYYRNRLDGYGIEKLL